MIGARFSSSLSFIRQQATSSIFTASSAPKPHVLQWKLNRSAPLRSFAIAAPGAHKDDIRKLRNIGISAHIDSGKTTLTERILYYSGRIKSIHEVKGKDGKGATMDFMELEREKGITIQAAATHVNWRDSTINIIDTPGHVDFTIEVERALRVLDGAILVLCGVAGVQSQTITVDRQMRRYAVPRLLFVNKLDRAGANPWRGIDQFRTKLGHKSAAVQVPIGLEAGLQGIIDIVSEKVFFFEGDKGDNWKTAEVPEAFQKQVAEKKEELVTQLVDIDDTFAEIVLSGAQYTAADLKAAIRRATLARKFIPIFMGSAYKNKGVQPLLDGVIDYLPNPLEKENFALDPKKNNEKVLLSPDPKKDLVAFGFKLDEGKYGQLTYLRVYQGCLKKGDVITNQTTGKKFKVPRLVKMHANEMEDISEARAGEICAMFGVDCNSGTTFTAGDCNYLMNSMHVPDPVISLAVSVPDRSHTAAFSKAIARFQKEDPTFRVHVDPESNQTIISGMGELHLEIYQERMKRDYKIEVVTGKPKVAFRETCKSKGAFDYTHKKQSGGAGQYAKVIGFVEPINDREDPNRNEFVDATIGQNIPPEYMPAIGKGFDEACRTGPLLGAPLVGVRFTVTDGQAHVVDSSELAFKIATLYATKEGLKKGGASLLEPIMKVEVTVPIEFQGEIIGGLNKRKGAILSSDAIEDYCTVLAEVPLNNMFGYSTELRSATQGKGEFTMEYLKYEEAPREVVEKLLIEYKAEKDKESKEKDSQKETKKR